MVPMPLMTDKVTDDKEVHVVWNGITRAPLWSQAWDWGSQVGAWWPGLCPQDPARHSPKERRSEGAGAM